MHCPAFACCSILALLILSSAAFAERTTKRPENPLYETIADEVFLQEIGEKIPTDAPITAISVYNDTVYLISEGALYTLDDGKLEPIHEASEGMLRLFTLDDALWGTTADGVYRLQSGEVDKVFDGVMVDLCVHAGAVHGVTMFDKDKKTDKTNIFRFENGSFVNIKPESGWLTTNTTMIMEDGTQILADPVELGPIDRIASYSGTLHLLAHGRPNLLEGPVYNQEFVEWGQMPSPVTRDMLALGSRLFITTDRGVGVLRGTALTTLDGVAGLPFEDTTCLTKGFAEDLWIGTTTGAIRKVGDDFHYFGAQHWLPADNVHDIAVDGQTVYIATDGGVGVIRCEPYTLRKKAAYFEELTEKWGHKRLGFVHKLFWDKDTSAWLREISDNDGGHTAHYLAAMCFKYAATGDDSARREALDSFQAMRWLQTITGTDGFFARSIWAEGVDQGERGERGSGGLPAKWYKTDDGRWSWKGDTSSDEVNGHFYAVSLFHDLVAQGEEKQQAADHLSRIAKHIIDNGWVLRDMDGKPTRWGRWDPEYLLQPYGYESRGLNGMEAQSYVWTAYALTGNDVFKQGLDQLIEWNYHRYTPRQKVTFPPENVVTWDDELAFHVIQPLITYCDDPYLRGIYLRGLQRHWEVMRMQKLPYFNFTYGGLTGNDCEAAEATQHLREWSLDTVSHSYRNSHRSDLATEPGYTPYMGGTRAISPRELACSWGSRSAIRYDGGGQSRQVAPPVGWLEDYWLGRYYGMIGEPMTDDPDLMSVNTDSIERNGAEPYDGPPRP